MSCPAYAADLAVIAERITNARALIAECLTVLATAYVDADLILDRALQEHQEAAAQPQAERTVN